MNRPEKLPLSVFIIAFNEADRIGATLAAAREIADDIVVVDSGSSDRTREIAAGHGARVELRSFDGYGPQKRYAQSLCRHEWVLALDADEVIGPAVIAEIRAVFANGEPPLDAYGMLMAETFPGEREPKSWAYSVDCVRLYRRSKGQFSLSPVHDVVELAPGARTGRIAARAAHYSVRSLGEQITKLNRYSDMQADDLDARGRTISAIRLPFEFVAGFLKAYVGRRHVLRGAYGFMTAMNYAIFRYLRVAKHIERRLQRKQRVGRDG